MFVFADTSTGEHVSLKIDRVNILAIKTKRNITKLPPYSGVHCVAPRGWFTIRVSTIVFLRGEWWCCKTDWWVRYVGISPVPTLTQNPASSRSLFSSIVYTDFRDLTVTYIIHNFKNSFLILKKPWSFPCISRTYFLIDVNVFILLLISIRNN